MKITNIKKVGDVYWVVYAPSLLEKLVGVVEKCVRFMEAGGCYKHAPYLQAFRREDGELMPFTDKTVRELNRFINKF